MTRINWQESYLTRFYPRSSGWIDGTAEFHSICREHLKPRDKILEIGAGLSNNTSRFLCQMGELHGVDMDPVVMENDALQEAYVITDDHYPVSDGVYDVCISDYVLEHVEYPKEHLSEVYRVLKPGGVYIFRTPNLWHYVALVARLTPYWFHILTSGRLRNHESGSHDPYPTFYRINSKKKITELARNTGFSVEAISLVEKEPSYGLISKVLFLLFVGYERIVNSSEAFAIFRANIFAVLRKGH